MDVLDVPLTAAALLLAISGPTKLVRPAETERALRLTGLPSSRALVRQLGAVELVTAIFVLLYGDNAVWPLLLGVLYAGFAVFVTLAVWRRAPLSSCGCFGASGVAPTPVHAGVDAGLAAVGFVTAFDARTAPIDIISDGGTDAVVLVAGAVALAGSVYWLFTRWSGTRSAR
jgi:hypothetical protein